MTASDAQQPVLVDDNDGVATITLNRPDRLNAFNDDLIAQLGTALDRADRDRSIRAIVLTGAGRGFSAGGDVAAQRARADSHAQGTGADIDIDIEARVDRLVRGAAATSVRLHRMGTPTIAAVNGPAAGAGLALALACDLRVMSRSAIMTTAFARVGFSGDYGASWFLTNLVGTATARELFFTSARVDSDRALALGLTNHVFDDESFRSDATEFAAGLAHGPTLALRYMKANLNRALHHDLEDAIAAEAWGQARTGLSSDHREGATAFAERRPPRFEGR